MIAQPWPACVLAMNAASPAAEATSASSITMNADLPPSSRNTFVMFSAAVRMTARPVAVEPVKDTMSTRGSPDS